MKPDIIAAVFSGLNNLLLIVVLAYGVHALFAYLMHRLDVLGCDLLRRRCESCGEPMDRCSSSPSVSA